MSKSKYNTAKVKVTEIVRKSANAWLIKFEAGIEVWVPYSSIIGWVPATNTIEITTHMLQLKEIPYTA